MTTHTSDVADLPEALTEYLEAQDALDNREYAGINAEPYEKLVRSRNHARAVLESALAAGQVTAAPAIGDELRDTLVAVSAAIAERDDRAAQKMISEILAASQHPPASPAQPGAVYAELPEPDFGPGRYLGKATGDAYTKEQLRDFADRTHALRMEQAAKAAPGAPSALQIRAITTAYEQGVGKGHQAYKSGKGITNPYDSAYGYDLAWQYGYREGKEQAQRATKAAPPAEQQAASKAAPATQQAGEREQERIAFKDAHRHLDLDEVPDAWGRPMFKHSHVEASWLGWIARASHGQAPASVLHLVHSAFAEIAMAFPKAFALHKVGIADTAVREALAAPPPECETEAEKRAFAFGWFKALESERMKADNKKKDPL